LQETILFYFIKTNKIKHKLRRNFIMVRLDLLRDYEVYSLVAKSGEGAFKPGNVCVINSYVEGDVYDVVDGSAVTDEFVLVTEPFLDITGYDVEEDFSIAEGKRFRGHKIGKNSIITVATADITGSNIAKGDKIEAGVGKNLIKVTDYTASSSARFEVVAVTSFFDTSAVQLRKKN
jgi:hypothetical protein